MDILHCFYYVHGPYGDEICVYYVPFYICLACASFAIPAQVRVCYAAVKFTCLTSRMPENAKD